MMPAQLAALYTLLDRAGLSPEVCGDIDPTHVVVLPSVRFDLALDCV